MAIDSALKRKCVTSVGVMGIWGLGVTPNSSEPVEWRQSVSRGYCGIAPFVPTFTETGQHINEQLSVALHAHYSLTSKDLTSMLYRLMEDLAAGTVSYSGPTINVADRTEMLKRIIEDVEADNDIDAA